MVIPPGVIYAKSIAEQNRLLLLLQAGFLGSLSTSLLDSLQLSAKDGSQLHL